MPTPIINLTGRRILITGGARGLGAEFVRDVCAAGGRVVFADILEAEGKRLRDELAEKDHEAHFVHVDLANPQSVDDAVKAAGDILGGLDGLVNNAAIASGVGGRLFEDIDIDAWDEVMKVNIRGLWLVTRAALPFLRKAKSGGRIVNLASDTALWGAPKLLHYVASKGAVIAMTRSMARELGDDGICVNAIAPGLTRVEVTEAVPQDRHDLYAAGRAISREQIPDDVTGVVLFLLSAAAQFVTGQLLPINGGFVMN